MVEEEINSTNLMKKLVKKWWFRAVIVFAIICSLINPNSIQTNQTSNNNSTKIETLKEELSLTDHYNKHKNYIRYICQEWLKMISNNQAHNFEGPTYAWEYQWKFIVKGTDDWILFRCEFIPYDNEWWMNLNNVEFEL